MDRCLFVPDQDLLEWSTFKFIEKRKDGPTGVIENCFDPFLLQRFNDDLRTRLFHSQIRNPNIEMGNPSSKFEYEKI
jgi:hypothetical protein